MKLPERIKNNRKGKYEVKMNKHYYRNKICLFNICRIKKA